MATLPLNDVTIRTREADGKIFFTVDDIERFPEFPEGPLVELIQGELYLMPSPTPLHQKITLELALQLTLHIQEHKIGEIFTAPIDVELSEEDLVIPDIIYIAQESRAIIQEKRIVGAPNLIIEIVSTNKKQDYIKKREIYEHYLVPEYIIVDPKEQLILWYHLGENNRYSKPRECKLGDEVPLTQIPGLSLKLKL